MTKIVVESSGMSAANEAALRNALKTFNESSVARDPEFLRIFAMTVRSQITEQLSQPGRGKSRRIGNFRKKVLIAGPLTKGRKANSFYLQPRTRKDRPRNFHIASRPGDPPAPDTAHLKRSTYAEKSGKASYRVGVAARYAEALEFGTRWIKARPFMRPAIKRALKIFGIRE